MGRRAKFLEHGEMHRVLRDGVESIQVNGLKNRKKTEGNRPYIMLLDDADVRVGDTLVGVLSEQPYLIDEVRPAVSRGERDGLDAFYTTERQRSEAKQQVTQSIQIDTNYGMVGMITDSSQTFSFDREAIDVEIDRLGEDVEELHRLVRQVSELSDKTQIKKGSFEWANDLLVKHPWIAEKVLPAILKFVTSNL